MPSEFRVKKVLHLFLYIHLGEEAYELPGRFVRPLPPPLGIFHFQSSFVPPLEAAGPAASDKLEVSSCLGAVPSPPVLKFSLIRPTTLSSFPSVHFSLGTVKTWCFLHM